MRYDYAPPASYQPPLVHIMERVTQLMHEAERARPTNRAPAMPASMPSPIPGQSPAPIPDQSPAPIPDPAPISTPTPPPISDPSPTPPPIPTAPPFWAQSQIHLPSFSPFIKDMPMDIPAPPTESPPQALPADDHMPPSAPDPEILHRLEMMEGQLDKHSQDQTALVKLVRQLSAKIDALPAQTPSIKNSRKNNFILVLLTMLFLSLGITGWLFWMSPEMMLALSADMIHSAFAGMLDLLAGLELI